MNNISLRDLFYVSQEYQRLVDKKTLYSSRPVKIPAPRFIVFYNGTAKQPETQWFRLSDLYEVPEENPRLELQVLVLNINHGNNEALKEKCRTLQEYMLYIERIRYYVEEEKKSLQDAVELSVEECIRENILADFLRENKAEAIAVSIFEYDEEKELRLLREAEREYGREEGKAEGRIEGKAEGRTEGLTVLIRSLKEFLPSFELVYEKVISNEEYQNISKETVRELYVQDK